MIRFALVSLSAVAALTGAMALSDASAQLKKPPPIAGEWVGRYNCTQGITALNLTVERGKGQAITATFDFGPVPENPEVPTGSYHMTGTYDDAKRHMKLTGARWIDAPLGYAMVGLDGHMTPSGQTISGYVPDLFGCSNFEIHRPVQLIG